MRKHRVILTCMVCLAAGGFLTASGQTDDLADRMIAAESDTVPVAGAKAPAEMASDPVVRIWEEIDNSSNGNEIPAEVQRFNPWSFSTTVGTSLGFFPRFGSFMNMYAAPQLNYAATDRLAFHAGVMVGRTMPVTGIINEETPLNAGMTNMSTYVAASYRLTENLVVHGSGTRSLALVPFNGELQSVQFNDLSIGATYNFGNFSIGATIHRSDAPFYSSPFGSGNPINGNPMYGTPLYW